jgi:hypothetical protein
LALCIAVVVVVVVVAVAVAPRVPPFIDHISLLYCLSFDTRQIDRVGEERWPCSWRNRATGQEDKRGKKEGKEGRAHGTH